VEEDGAAAGLGVMPELGIDVEDDPHVLRAEHLFGSSAAHDLVVVDHGDAVAVLGDHREVVGHDHDGEPGFLGELVDEVEGLQLGADVQMQRGFVHQEDPGGLGERPGNHHPLPLAPAHGVDVPAGEVGQTDLLDGFVDYPRILPALALHGPLEGHTAHGDDLAGGEGEPYLIGLGDHGDGLGDVALGEGVEVGAVEHDAPAHGREVLVEVLQEGGLAAAVGTEDT